MYIHVLIFNSAAIVYIVVSSPGACHVRLSLAVGTWVGKSDVSVSHTRSIEVVTGSSVAVVTAYMGGRRLSKFMYIVQCFFQKKFVRGGKSGTIQFKGGRGGGGGGAKTSHH